MYDYLLFVLLILWLMQGPPYKTKHASTFSRQARYTPATPKTVPPSPSYQPVSAAATTTAAAAKPPTSTSHTRASCTTDAPPWNSKRRKTCDSESTKCERTMCHRQIGLGDGCYQQQQFSVWNGGRAGSANARAWRNQQCWLQLCYGELYFTIWDEFVVITCAFKSTILWEPVVKQLLPPWIAASPKLFFIIIWLNGGRVLCV